MSQPRIVVFLLILMIPLSGCTSSLSSGMCGEGYEEMYGGYDYSYSSISIDSDNTLNVSVVLLNGGGGWLEESEVKEVDAEIFVSLYVKKTDGTEQKVGFHSTTWTVHGDSEDGSYWSTLLNYESPVGFCDSGCEEVKFSAGYQDGAIYYDGTCDSSPWIDVPQ
jgi:hypothetical protein